MNDANEEESDDGYDSDLFENPEKAAEFKCPICTCICKDPIETEPCGHLYCRGCLQKVLNLKSMSDINLKNTQNKEPSLCPSCRSPISETSRSKFVERQVLKLRVKCANYNIGCDWKGELNYFKKHLQKQCQFVSLLCKYCSIEQYLRGAQEQHFAQCSEYLIECNLCSQQIARKNIQSHTDKICPNLLILCPNDCGLQIKQHLLTNHTENQCTNRKIDCLYRCYGCLIQPKYTALKSHLSQQQVTHLELKVLYLERLAQSTELLSVSNTTGLYPEISGMYVRENKGYYGRPVWSNRNRKTYLIRYDNVLRGWVLDKKGFEREIVALRMGIYPTATAKHVEAEHILQLEQMLMHNLSDKAEEKSVESMAESEDEKKVQIIVGGKPKNKDKKRGLFCDGLWHIKGNVENSRIKVRGYTEREFDLEWEFKSLAAQMRRQRSGIQHVTMNNDDKKDNIRANYAVGCVCGKGMVKINNNPYNPQDKQINVICNVCGNNVLSGIECYHCPSKRCSKHMDGYDLCLACGAARQQTQNLSRPSCDCGSKLDAVMSFNAYPNTMRVSCNVCSAVVDGAVWHCSKKYVKVHERGFDLCINCGKTYVAKKAGLMSWFK